MTHIHLHQPSKLWEPHSVALKCLNKTAYCSSLLHSKLRIDMITVQSQQLSRHYHICCCYERAVLVFYSFTFALTENSWHSDVHIISISIISILPLERAQGIFVSAFMPNLFESVHKLQLILAWEKEMRRDRDRPVSEPGGFNVQWDDLAEQVGWTIDCLCQITHLSFLLFNEAKSAQACWMSLKLSNNIIHIYLFASFYGFNVSIF